MKARSKKKKEYWFSDDARQYERAQKPRVDVRIVLDKAKELANKILNNKNKAIVVDVCCGTGLSLKGIANHPNIKRVIGIDVSQNFLNFLKTIPEFKNVETICADAATVKMPNSSVDLVIAVFAHHHIKHKDKKKFLKNIYRILKPDGYVIVGEHILPLYEKELNESYKEGTRQFYKRVIQEITDKEKYKDSIELIQNYIRYGIEGKHEYKVDYQRTIDDFKTANLYIKKEMKVWPKDDSLPEKAGNFVFLLSK